MPKALSALAVSDSDEEDQESTPVIINGDSAGSSAKPTAPMPESSADNGKFFPSYFSIYVSKYVLRFHQVWYQGGVKATVSGVVEDLEFKISEGSDQNWCFLDSAQLAVSAKLRQLPGQSQENTNFGRSLLKF